MVFRASSHVEEEAPTTSPREWLRRRAWELPQQESAYAPAHVRTNADMDPVPPEKQSWTMWTWIGYWMTDLINLGTWETASSIVAVGLTWREAIPIMAVGTLCVAIPMVLNGAIGSKWHIPFAVAARASFGYYFSYFCVFSRAVLATFWFGIQCANGAACITIMLTAIWPSYARIPNHLPASADIDTAGMVSYLIFWVGQLPLLLIHPSKLKWLFLVKMVLTPTTALATMAWMLHKAHGGGSLLHATATVHGSAKAYLWLSCMSSVTGSWATLACNIPDFSRYAKTSRGQYIQLPALPIMFTLCGTMGVITTSASAVVYGTALWNPLDIFEYWLDNKGGRAAAFFAAFSWYVASVGTNITANSISAANDLTVLCPKYINIRRGSIIAALVGGWALVPWKIIGSASSFLSFMGGYSIFLGPMAGIMLADYWLVRKQHLELTSLYNPNGMYRINRLGTNPCALVAYLISVVPLIPGLAYSISPDHVSISNGLKHLYSFNWLFGFVCSIFLYTAFTYFEGKMRPARKVINGQSTTASPVVSVTEEIHTKEAVA